MIERIRFHDQIAAVLEDSDITYILRGPRVER